MRTVIDTNFGPNPEITTIEKGLENRSAFGGTDNYNSIYEPFNMVYMLLLLGGLVIRTQYTYLHVCCRDSMSTTLVLTPEKSKQDVPHVDISQILKAISDDKSLTLFNSIAHLHGKSDLLISKLGMTRKQFYARMERLSQEKLILKKNGIYHLTTMGKIIYYLQNIMGKAVAVNYWKFQTIDTLTDLNMPENELNTMIDGLIENHELKSIVRQSLRL